MGHGQRRKRNLVLSAGPKFGRKTLGIAAQKRNLVRPAISELAKPARELLRCELLTGSVQQNNGCARLDLQLAEGDGGRIAQLTHFHFCVMANSADVIVKKRPRFRAPCLAEHDEADSHRWIPGGAGNLPDAVYYHRRALRFRGTGGLRSEERGLARVTRPKSTAKSVQLEASTALNSALFPSRM